MEEFIEKFAAAIADRLFEKIETKREQDVASEKLYTIAEVCSMLHVSRSTLSRHRNEGLLIPTCYIGRKPLFDNNAIENYKKNSDYDMSIDGTAVYTDVPHSNIKNQVCSKNVKH